MNNKKISGNLHLEIKQHTSKQPKGQSHKRKTAYFKWNQDEETTYQNV